MTEQIIGFGDDPLSRALREVSEYKQRLIFAERTAEEAAKLEARYIKPRTDRESAAMADAQARCDAVAMAWGTKAPPSWPSETLLDYRVRLMSPFKKYSPQWKSTDVGTLARAGADVDLIEQQIYADAISSAARPEVEGDRLVKRTRTDEAGRQISEYYGSWRAAFAPFLAPVKAVTAIGDTKMRADAAIQRLAARGAI
jgi:hypothetical protein